MPKGTTRLESQAFRLLCVWPIVLALILWSFPIKGKGQLINLFCRHSRRRLLETIRHHLRLMQRQEMFVEQ